MRRFFLHRPSPSMVVALLALFAALAGTAIAAGPFIKGKNIKKRSIPGNRIKKDALTGTEIKESTLGTVPKSALATLATTATTALTANTATTATTANSANALNGVQLVAGPAITNPSDSQTGEIATCPAGMIAIAGGVVDNGNIEEAVNDAHIINNGGTNNAFLAHVNNISGTHTGANPPIITATTDTFHVYVACVHGSVTGAP